MDAGHRTLALKNEMDQNNNGMVHVIFELMLLTYKEISLCFLEKQSDDQFHLLGGDIKNWKDIPLSHTQKQVFLQFKQQIKDKDEPCDTPRH